MDDQGALDVPSRRRSAAGRGGGDDGDVVAAAIATSPDALLSTLEGLAQRDGARGDAAAAKGNWSEAVGAYTQALRTVGGGPKSEAALLCRRSAALVEFSRHIRSIPSRLSERSALYGNDPAQLCQLALHDAEKAARLRPTAWAEPQLRAGNALIELERLGDAEAAFLEGLLAEPRSPQLKAALERVQALLREQAREKARLFREVRRAGVADDGDGGAGADEADDDDEEQQDGGSGGGGGGNRDGGSGSPAAGDSARAKRQRRLTAASAALLDDLECLLCARLFYKPVTTPCGHTFCADCFSRSMDHSNRCAMCRCVLHVGRSLPVTVTLQGVIARALPDEYAERAAEAEAAAATRRGAAAEASAAEAAAEVVTLPLFVMSTLLPGEKMALNIFEPRYRLLVRRVMEGNRRLGMAQTGRTGPAGLDAIAVEAEITECQPQPDGRFYLEVAGRRRLRLTASSELDGYRVATAEVLRDDDLGDDLGSDGDDGGGADGDMAVGEAEQEAEEADESEAGAGAAAGADDAPGEGGAGQPPQPPQPATPLPQLAADVLAAGDALLDRLRAVLAARRLGPAQVRELLDRVGDKPPASSPEEVSWWAARLLLMLVPSSSEGLVRRELMAERSTARRLRLLRAKLAGGRLDGAGGGTCAVM